MTGFSRVFTLEVDGRPILTFESDNSAQAKQLSKETWLIDDLSTLTSGGAPITTPQSTLSVRFANAEEAIVFGHVAQTAKLSDDLMIAFLVELDKS
jgi:hypothetical protein